MTQRITIAATIIATAIIATPDRASAQTNCQSMPAGPARTDCYIGLSRGYAAQSDVAAGQARVQSDAARYRQVTGAKARAPSRRK